MSVDNSDTISKLREGINKDLKRKAALDLNVDQANQVDQWIEMPEWFLPLLGIGKSQGKGIPCGHITQFFGDPDTGKTSMLIQAMIECQKQGGIVFLLDAEQKFPYDMFVLMGGDLNRLIPLVANSSEEAWELFDSVIQQVRELRKKDPLIKILLVWDSITASIPDAILESEAGDHNVATQAKQNNQEILKLRQSIRRTNIAAILINHHYAKIDKYASGPMEILKGGKELYWQSTLIVKFKKLGWVTKTIDGIEYVVGTEVRLEPYKVHTSYIKGKPEIVLIGNVICFADEKEKIEAAKENFLRAMGIEELETVEQKEAKAAALAAEKSRKKK